MSNHLLIRFTNESGMTHAEVGPSIDGYNFSAPQRAALVIYGSEREVAEKGLPELVKGLPNAIARQLQDTDNDEFIRGQAHKARNYIADALLRKDVQIVYATSANDETLDDLLAPSATPTAEPVAA